MRIAVAVFTAALLLTGCKKVVGPAAPETPTAAEAPAAAAAADTAATADAAAAPAPGGDRGIDEGNTDRGNRGNDDREGNTDRGNRGNDDREGNVAPAAPQG